MAESNRNLWAPWRMQYVGGCGDQAAAGCFLCQYAAEPAKDAENLVIWRSPTCITLFNRFPYSNGHLMIAPVQHAAELAELPDDALLELMHSVRDAQRLLGATVSPQGFNVGMNFGKCAGAGLPGHLHVHIVPRWEGDTNFMSVVGDTRVIPESIEALRTKMRELAPALGLPAVRE